jgi:hypothetical protein
MRAPDKFLAVVNRMADKIRSHSRPDARTAGYFELTLDELMHTVYALEPYLPPEQQDTLLEIWEEYACILPSELEPASRSVGAYPEDRLQTLLERFRKLVA